MNLSWIVWPFSAKYKVRQMEPIKDPLEIIKLDLTPNPRYIGKLWGYRPLSRIKKIIVHQALSEAATQAIHNYHISKESHLKLGHGAPKIAYHYTIEKDGKVYLVNDLTDIVWHAGNENVSSIGVLLCGDFGGVGHVGKSDPSNEQITSLGKLLDKLTSEFNIPKKDVYGHCDFGKPACPGFIVMDFIKKYRG